ncbi:MAG: hypothetical protein QOE16_1496 [Microbacteriaceae bacterium]|jgi:pimeloyl-ACP methyl ester carboxylesterase|nr:hypothetical protein [Microbacteriaceae bacterium]
MTPSTAQRVAAVVTADTGGDGEVFLLIHGIGVSSRYFERLIPQLARYGRVVAIDLPGFGRAPRPGRAYSVEDFAAVAAHTIDRLQLPACVVVGHSMGAQIAARLARDRPDALLALALLGPVVSPRDRSLLRSTLRLAQDTLGETPRANWLVLNDYVRCGPRWYLSVVPSMLAYRLEDDLPAIDVPVVVVRGVRDPIAGRGWVAALAALGRNASAIEVPGSRHLVMHARPAATARCLAEVAR